MQKLFLVYVGREWEMKKDYREHIFCLVFLIKILFLN